MKKFLILVALLGVSLSIHPSQPQNPRVVIAFVIDQFPFYYFSRHQRHFKYRGFNRFIKEGILYTNAQHAHGIPETAPGHTTLSTGSLPTSHGVVSNRWFENNGTTTVNFTEDEREEKAVIGVPDDVIGRSPHHIKVDALADQMIRHQSSQSNYKAFTVAIKERSAIATAGQNASPFWFNTFRGGFTSSKHYMQRLPRWVKKFNERCGIRQLKKVSWPLSFEADHPAYDFPDINNYDYAGDSSTLAGKSNIPINHSKKNNFEYYVKTPAANKLILDFAECCINNMYKKRSNEKILLWVCLSPLDLVGHIYGPDSLEIVDFIHHIDRQLSNFMSKMERKFGNKVMFVLAADHGVQPIQEISQLQGIEQARRIMAPDLIKRINGMIAQKYDVDNFITRFESTYFIYNIEAAAHLKDKGLLDKAEVDTKKLLLEEPGIKRVWTYDELKKLPCQPNSHEQFYKNHLHEARLGNLIVQPEAYCLVTNYPTGCSHNTPYNYDTHIPLAFYQKGMRPQHIDQPVYAAQLAGSIAKVLDVPPPAASLLDPLPHIVQVAH
ncbi:hypothetical protein FJ364_00185 [Candidatus Dependentiae bacterium]|nr:hypothetical protein [Candidatus Dependentiae bacterium]